jgi:hypothetical protein
LFATQEWKDRTKFCHEFHNVSTFYQSILFDAYRQSPLVGDEVFSHYIYIVGDEMLNVLVDVDLGYMLEKYNSWCFTRRVITPLTAINLHKVAENVRRLGALSWPEIDPYQREQKFSLDFRDPRDQLVAMALTYSICSAFSSLDLPSVSADAKIHAQIVDLRGLLRPASVSIPRRLDGPWATAAYRAFEARYKYSLMSYFDTYERIFHHPYFGPHALANNHHVAAHMRDILHRPLFRGVPVVMPGHFWSLQPSAAKKDKKNDAIQRLHNKRVREAIEKEEVKREPIDLTNIESQAPNFFRALSSAAETPEMLHSALKGVDELVKKLNAFKEADMKKLLNENVTIPLQDRIKAFEPFMDKANHAAGIMDEISSAFLKVFTGVKILVPVLLPVLVAFLVERLMRHRPRWVRLVLTGMSVALVVLGYGVLTSVVTEEVATLMAETRDVESQGATGVIGATAKLVVSLLAAKGFSLTNENFGTFLSKYAGISRGFDSIIADIFNLFAEVCATCTEYLPVAITSRLLSEGPVKEFIRMAGDFNVRFKEHNVPSTDASKSELAMLIRKGENILAARKNGNSGEDTLLRSYIAALHKVQDVMVASMGSSNVSRRPVVVFLLGEPGGGKTLAANSIGDTYVRNKFSDNEQALMVYEANPKVYIHDRIGDKYWEGVTPTTEVVLIDDFAQQTTVPGTTPNAWGDVIGISNEKPFQPVMAFDKAQYCINPSLLMVTTNIENLRTNMIISPPAFGRRLDIIVRVKAVGSGAKAGYDPKCSKFQVMRLMGEQFVPTEVVLTYEELYMYILERNRMYEAFARATSGNSAVIAKQAGDAYKNISDADLMKLIDRVNKATRPLRTEIPFVPRPAKPIMIDPNYVSGEQTPSPPATPTSVPVPSVPPPVVTFHDDIESEAFPVPSESSSTTAPVEYHPIPFDDMMDEAEIPLDQREETMRLVHEIADREEPAIRQFIEVTDEEGNVRVVPYHEPPEPEGEWGEYRDELARITYPLWIPHGVEYPYDVVFENGLVYAAEMAGENPTVRLPDPQDVTLPLPVEYEGVLQTAVLNTFGVAGSGMIFGMAISTKMGNAWRATKNWTVEKWSQFLRAVKYPWFHGAMADLDPEVVAEVSPRTDLRWYQYVFTWDYFKEMVVSLKNGFFTAARAVVDFVKAHPVMVGLAATACFMAVGFYSRQGFGLDDIEEQSAGQGRFGGKNGKPSGPQRPSVKNRLAAFQKSTTSGVSAEGFTDLDQLVDKFQKNIYGIEAPDADGHRRKLGHILGVRDKMFTMNVHFFTQINIAWTNLVAAGKKADFCFYLTRPGLEWRFSVDDLEILEEQEFNDCLLVSVKTLPQQFADISRHFMTKGENLGVWINRSMTSEGMLVGMNTKYVWENGYPLQSITMDPNVPELTSEVRQVMAYPLRTEKGMCGWPVVITNGAYAGKIFGFHCAGNGRFGFCNRVTIEQFSKIPLDIPFVENVADLDLPAADDSVVEYEGFAFDRLPEGMDILTMDLSEPSNTFVSNDIVRYEGVGPLPMEPKTMPSDVRPERYPAARAAYVHTDLKVDMEHMVVIGQELTRHFHRCAPHVTMRRYTLEEAIRGIRGTKFKPLDASTSPGYPHTALGDTKRSFWRFDNLGNIVPGPKFEALRRRLTVMIELIVTCGALVQFTFQTVHKGERRSIAKVQAGKTRIVFCGPLELLILYRMFFGAADLVIKEGAPLNGTLIGINPRGWSWDFLVHHLKVAGEGKYCGSGDFAGFDGHQNQAMVRNSLQVQANLYPSDDRVGSVVRASLIESIVQSYHVFGGLLEQWHDNMPSGFPGTTPTNCITNLSMFMYHYFLIEGGTYKAYPRLHDFWNEVKIVVLGDDNLFSVSHRLRWDFSEATFAKTAELFGHTYTAADKGPPRPENTPLEDHTILKCGFVFHKDLSRWVGPLAMDVIMERVLWTKNNKDYDHIAQNNLSDSLLDLTMHGRETFKTQSKKLLDFYGPRVTPLWTVYDVALTKAAEAVDGFI